MEDAFKKLEAAGQNNADNLVKMMKDSKVIDGQKVTEEKALQMFNDAPDKNKISLEKFKDVLSKIAAEVGVNVQDLISKFTAGGGGGGMLQSAMGAAASAFGK